ncbi:two-component regulator propeller domain-containing protein [Mariniflexile ostreae]|uniref:Two-component regulator propeller domain-containing protein n=1 Tax=Mariniflexile ostreae TaxID=1520892 RepID=A0ABV5FFI2_9FLAO
MLEQHLKNYNHMFYKHVMNVISLYILVFAISISSYAQNPDLRFKTVEYGENFPQSTISSIVQSKKGFIWLGTDNGLVRYDGYEFLRYYTQNKEEGTISNNIVTCIYEDAEENLWVGTNHGVNLYNKKADNFTGVDISSVKGGPNYISSFVEDDEGNLWVGTFGGVRKINKKNLLLEGGTNDSSTAFNNKVFALLYDPAFGVLVSTHLGLQCFNPRTGLEIELPALLKNHPTFLKEKVLKIIKDDCGDLWFATESGGVFWFSKNEYQLINYKHIFNNANSISTNNIKDIVSVDTNTIWFATDNGLNVFKKDSKKFKVYEHSPILSTSISDNNITSLLKDREGSIWLGTKTGSIDFYNESNLNFINIKESVNQNFGLNNTIVNALVSDYNGALWAGTNGGGLNYLDFKTHKNQSYLIGDFKGNNIIKALVHKDENTLLCGTLFGLYQFDKRSNRFSKIPISGTEVQVSSIAVDNDDIWVGTDGNGLIHISKNGAIKTYRKGDSESSISDNFILHIENRDNGLWVSTQFGLNFFNKNTKAFTSFFKTAQNHSLPNNTLTALYSDSKNRLWIGLGYGGLSYFDTKNKKFYLINESLGLTDGAIKSIAEDNQGNLWVSSNNLLFKITIKQFELPFKASNFEITSYGSSDGIAVKNYVLNSSAILGDALAFGGAEGLVLFNPNKILKPKVKNKVVLTKLIVNNQAVKFSPNNTILEKDISEASEIALNHNQKFIGLQFSSLNFINTENNTYAYKLEGAFEEEDWQNIGTQNSINLAALNSGTYTFKVKPLYAGNAGDIDTIKSLKINILSPWWQTYWAYALYMVLLLLVFLIIIKFIKSKVVIKQALLLKQSESERQRELYNMKLDFFTNISHEIRTH